MVVFGIITASSILMFGAGAVVGMTYERAIRRLERRMVTAKGSATHG